MATEAIITLSSPACTPTISAGLSSPYIWPAAALVNDTNGFVAVNAPPLRTCRAHAGLC